MQFPGEFLGIRAVFEVYRLRGVQAVGARGAGGEPRRHVVIRVAVCVCVCVCGGGGPRARVPENVSKTVVLLNLKVFILLFLEDRRA